MREGGRLGEVELQEGKNGQLEDSREDILRADTLVGHEVCLELRHRKAVFEGHPCVLQHQVYPPCLPGLHFSGGTDLSIHQPAKRQGRASRGESFGW
jgi:hypothetical protein